MSTEAELPWYGTAISAPHQRREAGIVQAVADHFEDLLDAGADDAVERCLGDPVRRVAILVAERRHEDQLGIV